MPGRSTTSPPGSHLRAFDRLLVLGTSGLDLGLRTLTATAVGVPAALWAARADGRRELARLEFYRELAAARDPERAFPPPRSPAAVSERDDGRMHTLCFESPFEAVNPAMREDYARHRENRVAWAQHWRHADGPRPTLAVIHGFGASPYWLNSAFFSLPWLYRKGYDILLYLLPFHGVRQARAAFSGWGLFAHGPAHFNEAIAHAVHDFRMLLDHLADRPVAVTGLSLGGYVSALLASVDPRPVLAIPNAPVVDIGALGKEWFPANVALSGIGRLRGVDLDDANAAFAVHSPLTYEPLVPRARRMIIGGLGDRLAPPSQAAALWEHWDRPRIHWFPGNHVLHAGRSEYLREMLVFMRDNDFAPAVRHQDAP